MLQSPLPSAELDFWTEDYLNVILQGRKAVKIITIFITVEH